MSHNMLASLKGILKKSVALYYIQFGFIQRAIKNIASNQAIVSIYFHNPTLKTFHDCIQWLIDNNFEFIAVNDLLNINEIGLESSKPKVIITIDDGWRDNLLNMVPIAHFNKIPITFFITTEPLIKGGAYWWSYINAGRNEGITSCSVPFLKKIPNANRQSIVRYVKSRINLDRESMTVKELKAIAASPYILIGAHTVSHPILTMCSEEFANTEIEQSKLVLDKMLPAPVSAFSYPNGDFTEREVKLLKKNGYKMAFTTKPSLIYPKKNLDLFRLPRFEVLDNTSLNENICRMTGVWF